MLLTHVGSISLCKKKEKVIIDRKTGTWLVTWLNAKRL